jgi:hypothetical protein
MRFEVVGRQLDIPTLIEIVDPLLYQCPETRKALFRVIGVAFGHGKPPWQAQSSIVFPELSPEISGQ